MTEEKATVKVGDLLEDAPTEETMSPEEEIRVLFPEARPLEIAGRSLSVRKLRLTDYLQLARDVMGFLAELFLTGKGESEMVSPAQYAMALLPYAPKIMASTLNVDEEWTEKNATALDVSRWLKAFIAIHPTGELREIRRNFSEAANAVRESLQEVSSPESS